MKVRARYSAEGAEPVRVDFAPSAGPPLVVADDLIDPGPVVRHAADKLGPLLCTLAAGHSPRERRRSEEHTSELQSRVDLVCRLLLEKKTLEAKGFSLARRRGRVHAHDNTAIAHIIATVKSLWRADCTSPSSARRHVTMHDHEYVTSL